MGPLLRRRTTSRSPEHVFAVWIRATPEQVWEAITTSDYTSKYYYASTVESDFRPGAPIVYRIEGNPAIVGEVIESTPPEKLVTTFDAQWDDEVRVDPPSRITWILEQAAEGVSACENPRRWTGSGRLRRRT